MKTILLRQLKRESSYLKSKSSSYRLKATIIVLPLIISATGLLKAQSVFTNTVANTSWGNAINWDPNGIPNGINAIVTTGSAVIETTNTTENIGLSGAFPYVFGTLNGPVSGTVGTIGVTTGSTTRQLKAQVSSGTPTINVPQGTMFFFSTLYGNQGLTKTGSGNLTFRFNTAAQQYTGTVFIAQGAINLNQDSSLGNATNSVVISDQAALCAGLSGGTQTVTVSPLRNIILNAPGGAGRLFVQGSGFTNIIQGVISESAAGSGLEVRRPVTQFSGTFGTVMLCNSNTYTGPTTATEGLLILSNQNAIALSTLTLNGGTVAFHNGVTTNAFNVGGLGGSGNLALQNTAAAAIVLTAGGNGLDTVYSGNLTGAGTLVKVGSGTLDLQGAGNNTAGQITVSNGTVVLDKTSTATVHAINNGLVLNGGTARLAGSGGDQIANANLVTLNSGTFDLNGQTETVGGVTGNGGTISDSTLGGSSVLQVNVASGSVTNGSTITGGNLFFGGAGTQVFTGSDTRDAFTPGLTTSVTNGTLQLGTGGGVVAFGGSSGISMTAPGTLALNFSGTFANNLSGSGNLAINSAGSVIVSGSDTHTGNTLVNLGTLAIPSGGTSVGGSVITVASNASFNVSSGSLALANGQNLTGLGSVTGNFTVGTGATTSGNLVLNGNVTLQAGAILNPGSPLSAGTITNNGSIINSGSYTLLYSLVNTNTPGGGTNSLLVVSGNLDVGSGTSAAKVVINGSPLNGTYVLAKYGSFSGTIGQVSVTGPSGRQTYAVQTNGSQLLLIVGGQAPQSIVWRGDGSANVWDGNNSLNLDWFNTGLSTPDYFGQGDTATFDNSATNLVVNLSGDLLPQAGSTVTINSTNNYTLAGSGVIDGSVSLTKNNTGILTLQSPNNFSGVVNLNGGVVSVATVAPNGAASPLGSGTSLAFNGGTLQYTGPNADGTAFNRAVNIGTNGATIDQSGSGYLYLAGPITGSGALTKTGTNQLVISGNNTSYTNTTFVKNGQLELRNVNGLGTTASQVIVTNPGASLASGGGLTGIIVKPLTLAGAGDGNGVLQANSSAVVNFSGAVNLVTNASIGGSGASNLMSGVISGSGLLTKVGSGTIVLAASNTYTGGTVISSGTLQLGIGSGGGNNGWLPVMPAAWVLTNNGVLAINHTNATILTNAVSGNGWIHQIGTGTLTLGVSNNFTGGNVFNYPTIGLAFTGAVGVDGPVLVSNSYAFGTLGAASTGKIQLAGNINIPAPLAVWSSSAGVTNIENLSGTNILSSVFGLYGSSYWPITASGGLLSISTFSNVIYNSTFTRTIQLLGAANGFLTNTIDPSFNWLQIQKDGTGTWTLSGGCDAPQGLIVNAGTLVIDTNAYINSLQRSQVIAHSVTGGKLIVNGSLTVGSSSGAVTVSGGLIGGSGIIGGSVNVQAAGAVSPSGGIGTNTSALTINGDLNLAGNVSIQVNKSLSLSNDFMTVYGNLTNSGLGILTVSNNGPALSAGDTLPVFSQALSNGSTLAINQVVRGSVAQYVTWTNRLAVDGTIAVLSVAPLGTNANLTSLALNPTDSLTPAFATNVFVYAATNGFGVLPTLTVTNANLTASNILVVNGVTLQTLTSGVPSLPITNLVAGSTNVLKVLITAQDTVTTNLYTINLTQLSVNTNAFAIQSTATSTNILLKWPPDRIGWRLQVQTNSLSTGVSTNWYDWPGSTTITNLNIPINLANPSVFFRMRYP